MPDNKDSKSPEKKNVTPAEQTSSTQASKEPQDKEWQDKLAKLKDLQGQLAKAFQESEKYKGDTAKDAETYKKIEKILNDLSDLTDAANNQPKK